LSKNTKNDKTDDKVSSLIEIVERLFIVRFGTSSSAVVMENGLRYLYSNFLV
jgi:hypothetical protein